MRKYHERYTNINLRGVGKLGRAANRRTSDLVLLACRLSPAKVGYCLEHLLDSGNIGRLEKHLEAGIVFSGYHEI